VNSRILTIYGVLSVIVIGGVTLGCDGRKGTIDSLCRAVTVCQTGAGGEFSAEDRDAFMNACKHHLAPGGDSAKVPDATLVSCRRCVGDLKGNCAAIYGDHDCDAECAGIDWISNVFARYDQVNTACQSTVNACFTGFPGEDSNDAGQGHATAIADLLDASSCTANPRDGGSGSKDLPESAFRECGNLAAHFLWWGSGVNRPDAGAADAGGEIPIAGSDGGDGGAGTISIGPQSQAMSDFLTCSSCLGAQGVSSLCGEISAACSKVCSGIPQIGSYLAKTPEQYVCQAAIGDCSAYFDSKAKDLADCIARVTAARADVQTCAANLRTAWPTDASGCPTLSQLAGCSSCSPVSDLLFTPSPARLLCQQSATTCGTGTQLELSECLKRTASAATEVAQCSTCLKGTDPAACLGSSPAACSGYCQLLLAPAPPTSP
jgi:hypothetical protein